MGKFHWILGLFVSTLAFADGDLDYHLEYRPGPNPELAIRLTLEGESDGTTDFVIPSEWAGQEGYEKGIQDLAVHGGELKQISPNQIEVRHEPGKLLTVSYRLVQAWKSGVDSDGFYWPVIRQEYFHFFGHGAFIEPTWKENETRTIHLSWDGIPSDWQIANSHGAQSRQQAISATLSQLSHAVYLAGDFRIHRVEVEGKPVYVAIRGQWSFTDAQFLDLTRRIFQGERDFFQDYDYPYYFLSLIQSDSKHGNGGTGLTNSFSMQAGNEQGLKPFEHLLAHELFHNWNGRKIRRMDPEELVYWFSEGFTEYYARKIRLRAGIIDLPEYVDGVNQALLEYSISPAKNASNDRILKEFWTNDAVGKMPYLRGELIALLWNTRIHQRDLTRSLDDFMRDLFHEAVGSGTVVAPDSVDRLLRPYLAEGVLSDLDSLVDRGETVPVSPEALGPCVSRVEKSVPTFDIGFDVEASYKAGVIVGIRPHSAAQLAGLRDGLKLIHTQYRSGDPFTPATVTVQEADGAKREIRYDPQGEAIQVPQYRLDQAKYLAAPALCLSWFQ